jgi:3,4-dihydroxy 2-butanone 4-phosphate synthase
MPEIQRFGERHGLPVVTIDDIKDYILASAQAAV